MKKSTIRYAKAGCLVALAAIVVYAFVTLYVLSRRADLSILIMNVILFAAAAGLFIYLSKKEKDIEEEELFRD